MEIEWTEEILAEEKTNRKYVYYFLVISFTHFFLPAQFSYYFYFNPSPPLLHLHAAYVRKTHTEKKTHT